MQFETKLNKLKNAGLNLFAAIPYSHLTEENKALFKTYSLELAEDESLCLVAHGGKSLWEKLPAPPIDDYSIEQVRTYFPDARIYFPGPGLYPLQQIGRMMNMGTQSPIGIDINPDFGLWFAYRCLFVTKEKIHHLIFEKTKPVCDGCADKPCLREKDFQQARLSCPYKAEHRYSDEQLRYHRSQLPT